MVVAIVTGWTAPGAMVWLAARLALRRSTRVQRSSIRGAPRHPATTVEPRTSASTRHPGRTAATPARPSRRTMSLPRVLCMRPISRPGVLADDHHLAGEVLPIQLEAVEVEAGRDECAAVIGPVPRHLVQPRRERPAQQPDAAAR